MLEVFLACVALGLAILSFFITRKAEALAGAVIALAALHLLAYV